MPITSEGRLTSQVQSHVCCPTCCVPLMCSSCTCKTHPEPEDVVGWQVWWGICDMRPHWPPFKTRAEADDFASMIKSNTEVRALVAVEVGK